MIIELLDITLRWKFILVHVSVNLSRGRLFELRASLHLEKYTYIYIYTHGSKERSLQREIRSGEDSRYWPRYWMGLVSRLCTRRHPRSGKLTVWKGWRASNRFSFHSFKRKRTPVLTRTAGYREGMVNRCRSGIRRSPIIKLMMFDDEESKNTIFI